MEQNPLSLNERMIILESQHGEIINRVCEINMLYHKMQSDLREFEKQKINPLKEKLERGYYDVGQQLLFIKKLENRMNNQDNFYPHQQVISKPVSASVGCSDENCKNDKFKVRLSIKEIMLLCACGLVSTFSR